MSAMMLYGEEVRLAVGRIYQEGKPLRIIPAALAMGWIHHRSEQGQFPGVAAGDFAPFLFSRRRTRQPEGAFLVEATWFAALYGQSPEGKFLPLRTRLTAAASRRPCSGWPGTWSKNYPDCGLYRRRERRRAASPEFSPPPSTINDVTRVTLDSSTPGAWFRYTLDGTLPTRTRGYIYCGVISVRPGMTLKALAYKAAWPTAPWPRPFTPVSREKRNRSRGGRGLVHFSADQRCLQAGARKHGPVPPPPAP